MLVIGALAFTSAIHSYQCSLDSLDNNNDDNNNENNNDNSNNNNNDNNDNDNITQGVFTSCYEVGLC